MTTLNEIIIWNNSNIKVNGKTVYYQPWHCKGVAKLVGLLDNQNRFLAFDAFKRKYNVKTTFIDYLTNRFHFAVRLYSDNAQMTSKRGENKEVRYEPQASSVTDVLTAF